MEYKISGTILTIEDAISIDISEYAAEHPVDLALNTDPDGKLTLGTGRPCAVISLPPAKRKISVGEPDDFGFCVLTDEGIVFDAEKVKVAGITGCRGGTFNGTGGACSSDSAAFALESMTGGTNTLLYDDAGRPSVMVRIPAFKWSDVWEDGDDALCSAFIAGGKELDCIYISKYLNVIEYGRAYSLPGRDPAHTIDLERARKACANKGRGWHLMTNAEWMALAFWCRKNGIAPGGNNFCGKNINAPHEHGILSHGGSLGVPKEGRTLTGSGPVSWNHDGTFAGISDLHGNIWDMVSGLRLMDGEIQIIPDNNSALNVDESENSRLWRAILPDGSLVDPGTEGTLKLDGKEEGSPEEKQFVVKGGAILSDAVANPQYNGDIKGGHFGYTMMLLKDLEARDGIKVPDILKKIGICPISEDIGPDRLFLRSYGERTPIRGGSWFDKANAGLWELYMRDHRHFIYPDIGFRSAYIDV